MGRRPEAQSQRARLAWATGEIRDRCHGKKAYASRGRAEKALATIARIAPKGERPVAAYACPSCKAWHLTSTPR
jgi:hypothetical protein